MSTEELIIALVRVLGSLPVLRWAFAGGVLAVLVDFSDLFLMNLLDLGGVSNYQAMDKWLDQVYMALFLVVALRWPDPARAVAVVLYLFRLAGFVLFELTGNREVLVLFPNLFEFWFLFVASLRHVLPAREPVGQPPSAAALAVQRGTETRTQSATAIGLGTRFEFTSRNVGLVLLALLAAKMAQEIVIHWLKLLDSFTAVEAVEAIWDLFF
jgi:hypothetical protein